MSLSLHSPRIGVDLGGTKIEVIALASSGQTLLRERIPTPQYDYAEIVHTIKALVAKAIAVTGPVTHVGVGVPGASDRISARIKNANTTCLIGKPLTHDLKHALGYPVVIENDANCFTLSEAVDGAGEGYRVVFGVILGTGVGGGWVVDQTLHQGMHHIAGEWGHNPIPVRYRAPHPNTSSPEHRPSPHWGDPFVDLGRECYCGLTDCIETHLCGSGLSRTHAWLDRLNDRSTPQLRPGQHIVDAARAGDPISQQTLQQYARQLACSLSTVINTIDPDVIVLGGGLSNMDSIYQPLRDALPEFVFNDSAQTPVLKARHGDSSGVRGAARLPLR